MKIVLDFILIGGIVITVLILFLLIKSNRKQPQNLLIILFLVLLGVTVNSYAYLHNINFLIILSYPFGDILEWLLGPLLLFYIKLLFFDKRKAFENYRLHLLPFFIYTIFISIPVFISLIKNNLIFNYLESLNRDNYYIIFIRDIFLTTYLLLSLYQLSKYRKLLKHNYSNLDNNDFSWIKYLLIGGILIMSIDLFTEIYELIFGVTTWNMNFITATALVFLIGYLGYYGVNQSKILLPDFLINDVILEDDKNEKINHLSNVSDEELQELESRLEIVLTDEKPYLDEDLTLNKLAKLIPTTDKKLSTFLNHHLNTTFYDIINEYRVESVKEKLHSDNYNNITLLGIAYESGFNSKTSFNRIFKKETGLSPSEYKKSI